MTYRPRPVSSMASSSKFEGSSTTARRRTSVVETTAKRRTPAASELATSHSPFCESELTPYDDSSKRPERCTDPSADPLRASTFVTTVARSEERRVGKEMGRQAVGYESGR